MNSGVSAISGKSQDQQDELFRADEKLRSYLKDEVGLDLSRIDLDQLVASIKKNDGPPDSFDSFSASVSSLIAVHETYFMRHREQFDWIEQCWLPDILARKRNADESRIVRILSAGCATGEEAYSLCAHLKPVFDNAGLVLEIDAVDICENSLNTARRGRYSLWSLRGVSVEHEQQWLDVLSRNVEVKPWVKNSVNFYRHNITREFPLADIKKYDLVLCRNVMIYMHADAIRQAFSNIASLLKPDGVLIPGPSDPNPVGESPLQCSWVKGVRLFRKHNSELFPDSAKAADAAKDNTVKPSDLSAEPTAAMDVASQISAFTPYAEIDMQVRLCQYDKARQALEQNIESDMLDVRSYVMLAELAMDLEELRLAGTAIRNALFLRQDSLYVSYLMANYRRAVGDHDGERYALQWLKKHLLDKDNNQTVEFCEEFTVATLRQVIDSRLSC